MPPVASDMMGYDNLLETTMMPQPINAPMYDPAQLQAWDPSQYAVMNPAQLPMPGNSLMPGESMGVPTPDPAVVAGMGLTPEQMKMLMGMMPQGQQGMTPPRAPDAPTYRPAGARVSAQQPAQQRQGLSQLIYGR
jgi:hypothetical protein